LALERGKAVAIAALALVSYTLALCAVGQVMSLLQADKTVSNVGAVKAVGVGVYWDLDCVNSVTSIDWGTIEPGFDKTVQVYIKNEGNSASTLSMYAENWSPASASSYMTLNWDYSGQSVNPDEIVAVTFTLTVSSSIQGITSFSFDIVIVGSG
jgi:hypothetical protein